MSFSRSSLIPGGCLIALMACGDEAQVNRETESDDDLVAGNTVTVNGRELNGSFLNGVRLQGVRLQGVRLQGVRLQGVRLQGSVLNAVVEDGSLSELEAGDQLWGTFQSRLSGQPDRSLSLNIDGSRVDANGTHYLSISYQEDGSGLVANACPDGGEAIPIRGYWDDTANWIDGDDITLACGGGAVRKCIDWGYRPWDTSEGTPLLNYHLSCVRAVRADYCGTGTSYTHDGTPVNFFDDTGVLESEAEPKLYPDLGYFAYEEAAWGPDGAVCLTAHTRLPEYTNLYYADCTPVWGTPWNQCSSWGYASWDGTALVHHTAYLMTTVDLHRDDASAPE